jgi:hypothetical protein
VGLLLRGGRALARIAAETGISDSPNYIDQPPPQTADLTCKDYEGPEALEWLRTAPNGDDNAFASNRFQGTDNAIRLVETPYAAGAARRASLRIRRTSSMRAAAIFMRMRSWSCFRKTPRHALGS